MHFVRVLPVMLSAILLAAHFMRFHGIFIPLLILAFLPLLFFRHRWTPRFWQLFLLVATMIWINTGIDLVSFRLNAGMPWIRLSAIMLAVILFNILSALLLERKKVKAYYQKSAGREN